MLVGCVKSIENKIAERFTTSTYNSVCFTHNFLPFLLAFFHATPIAVVQTTGLGTLNFLLFSPFMGDKIRGVDRKEGNVYTFQYFRSAKFRKIATCVQLNVRLCCLVVLGFRRPL